VERIVVTGLGAVSPHGLGVERLWKGLRSGRTAIGEVNLFDATRHRTQLAGISETGEVPLGAAARRLSRADLFAIEAARQAFADAGLAGAESRADAGVFFGSSTGGMFEGERVFFDNLKGQQKSRTRARARMWAAQPVCSPANAVARMFGLHGPLETCATACAAATMAFESALESLRSGEVSLAIAGGSDGLCEMTHGGFNSLRAVSAQPTRPFRADRDGLNLGEGSGVVVLETETHASARGATVLGELAGAGSSCDAHHMTAPQPEGLGAQLAIERALQDAGVKAGEIDFINAHGTGTLHNDCAEWNALCRVFGEGAGDLPLTSSKGSVGHLLGACGGLEAVVTLLCLRAGEVHPTPGGGQVGPDCPVDLVLDQPRDLPEARTALSLNLAFGGANAALVLRGAAPGASS
jgi:3-oxoacyl-[acyl-carrier-protein] synthase II